MHARNVIAFFVWAWPSGFVTKAVSLGELLHEEVLPGGSTRTLISRLDFASPPWPDPLPTGLNGDGKNVQTLWWAELDRLHSMTRAHPPLARLTCQPKLAHDPVVVSFHQWDPGSILWRAFFFFFFSPPLFFFSSPLSPQLAFLFFPSYFCPPLISSSPFPLPSFLFFFLLFFSHSFFTSCFPLSAPFLSLFPPFILFS